MKPSIRSYRWPAILFLGFLLLGCGKGGTYPLALRYQPVKEFPSLREKFGSTLGMAPFKNGREEKLYIGVQVPAQGALSRFRSEPYPLEKAISESLVQVLARNGIKTVPVSDWDGKPESLKNMGVDSVLMMEIKKFWTEGRGSLFQTNTKTSIHLIIHLGVKKESKVFTRNVEVEKEMGAFRMTPEKVEQTVNQLVTEIFDQFFSNPY